MSLISAINKVTGFDFKDHQIETAGLIGVSAKVLGAKNYIDGAMARAALKHAKELISSGDRGEALKELSAHTDYAGNASVYCFRSADSIRKRGLWAGAAVGGAGLLSFFTGMYFNLPYEDADNTKRNVFEGVGIAGLFAGVGVYLLARNEADNLETNYCNELEQVANEMSDLRVELQMSAGIIRFEMIEDASRARQFELMQRPESDAVESEGVVQALVSAAAIAAIGIGGSLMVGEEAVRDAATVLVPAFCL